MENHEVFMEVFWTLMTFGFVVSVLGVILYAIGRMFRN